MLTSDSHRSTRGCWPAFQRGGETIATMDLMIATAAVVDEASLVTRDRKHFDRVPGVDVVRTERGAAHA